jgi:ferritin-like metal-binding protein YciE
MKNTLHDMFVELLQNLYDAENQIVMALPKLIENASDTKLKEGFSMHLDQTKEHVTRLEEIGKDLGIEFTDAKENKIMKTIIEEGDKAAKKAGETDVKDAVLIAGAQKVEHYEIAAYGTAAAWAKIMEHDDAKDLLGETLKEEKETDEKLSKIAEGGIFMEGVNEDAADADDDGESDMK